MLSGFTPNFVETARTTKKIWKLVVQNIISQCRSTEQIHSNTLFTDNAAVIFRLITPISKTARIFFLKFPESPTCSPHNHNILMKMSAEHW